MESSSSQPAQAPAIKLRLLCSNGGHILPRPRDKSLCYVGGETHIITMNRHTTLSNLTNRITKTLIRSSSSSSSSTKSFSLKYQLPSEDLDSLISITNDEDLENMIDEYERLNSNLKRIRLFVFPTGPVSVSSIGSDLENFNKLGDWFLNALNGTNSGFSDTSSVNCLLGLDDEKKDGNYRTAIDVHSIPDSPMMETTSSFGSASSIGNLPLIRVNGDDQLKVVGGGIEEQFAQLSVQKRDCKYVDDGGLVTSPDPVVVSGSPVSSAAAISENLDPFFFFHERTEQGLQMGYLKHQQQFQQKQSTGFDFTSPDSVLSDFTITDHLSPVAPIVKVQSTTDNNRAADSNGTSDQNSRIQMQQQQQIQNSAYLLSMPTTQTDTQRPQLHQQQMQYIQPLQYIHHHHPSSAVPVSSYYQQYPHQPPTNFLYYIPSRQPPQGYNYPLQQPQPSHADRQPAAATPNNQAAPKSELMAGAYRTTNSGGPQLVQVLSGRQNQNQYVGYSEIHHPSQPQYSQER